MSLLDDQMLAVFSEECAELLESSEEALLQLEDNPTDEELINNLFRAFHTVKGSGGIFGLDLLVAFTHIAENVLDEVRNGNIEMDEELISLFLESRDHLSDLVDASLAGTTELTGQLAETDTKLSKRLNDRLGFEAPIEDTDAEVTDESEADDEETRVKNSYWHISLRFGEDALRTGMDPASFINFLGKLGNITAMLVIENKLPSWEEFDPETCYLGFEISLDSEASKTEIEEVFEFVQDDCDVSILAPESKVSDYVKLIDNLSEEEMRLGDILLEIGALTKRELEEALNTQDKLADELTGDGVTEKVPPIGEVIVNQQVVKKPVVEAAVKQQKQMNNSSSQSVRVNAGKLEELINLVGELVISGANASLMSETLDDKPLIETMENHSRLVEEIRDAALSLRMVEIGDTFNKFKRVVREVSKNLEKPINLVIRGADTELDKTVVEKISDPLMHLIRNAMDHGIEMPDVREANGKSREGTVILDAYHDSGSIVISIKDDGGGLPSDKVRAKAIEKGLISEADILSDRDIYRLIFEPGFSTAEQVTNISGRGVGMDVVRSNIEALRGQVDVDSEPGHGSTFSIRLPLTLAIIDGFQVRVGNSHYIIPLDMVEECIELDEKHADEMNKSSYVKLRGHILPYVRLRELFGIEEADVSRENIVVIRVGDKRAGIVVDELLGEHQTVIKPLGKVFEKLSSISGATILGSGEVALIVDVPALISKTTAVKEHPVAEGVH